MNRLKKRIGIRSPWGDTDERYDGSAPGYEELQTFPQQTARHCNHGTDPDSCDQCMKPSCCGRCWSTSKAVTWLLLKIAFVLLVLGLLVWVVNLNERVQELEHGEDVKQSRVCAVHMYAHLCRPEPHHNNMYAMAHGSLTLDTVQNMVCYKLLTANLTDAPTSLALYGPLWSMEPEYTEDVFFELPLPTVISEPGMYAGCRVNVTGHVFKELSTKLSMFYVSAGVGPRKLEAMRGYLDSCAAE